MAQVHWTQKNSTAKVASYSEGGPTDFETQNKIIESIQEEQNRVYRQDQHLLKSLANPIDAKPIQPDDESEYEGMDQEYEYA